MVDKQDFADMLRLMEEQADRAAPSWDSLSSERPLLPFGNLTVNMARRYNRKLLLQRHPLKAGDAGPKGKGSGGDSGGAGGGKAKGVGRPRTAPSSRKSRASSSANAPSGHSAAQYPGSALYERPGLAILARTMRRIHGTNTRATSTWSPLKTYEGMKHPVSRTSEIRQTPFPTVTSMYHNAPAFSFAEKGMSRKKVDPSPGPNEYTGVTRALDKLSNRRHAPSFSIRGRLPGYMDKLCESGEGVNIGLPHKTVPPTGGRTFGVRHRHLDYKGRDETPSAQDYNLADYDSPWSADKLRKDRKRTRKHPKLGVRLKTREEIDRAIGVPITPGPKLTTTSFKKPRGPFGDWDEGLWVPSH